MSRRIATLKTLAGLQGNTKARADACHRLAVAYMRGDGVDGSVREAMQWWAKAAELGNALSQVNLGFSYAKGDGVAQSYDKAVE